MTPEEARVGRPKEQMAASTPATWALALGIVLLALLAYGNTAFHPFVYDDQILIVKNPEIRSLANVPEMIGFSEDGFRFRTRWTRMVTHAVEYRTVGLWAPLYHMTNIGLHAMAALLVFVFVGRFTEDRWIGWWAAALFAVHPIQSEVVAHVSGRRGLLAALFSIGALVLFDGYVRRGGLWKAVSGAACVYFGTFSKELAVMTPVAFVVLDAFRAAREAPAAPWAGVARHARAKWHFYAFLAVLTVSLAVAVLFFSGDMSMSGSPGIYDTATGGLGVMDRVAIVGLAVRLLVLPLGQSVDYSFDALGFASEQGMALAGVHVAVCLLALGLGIWGVARRNWAGFAGLWFAMFYLPHTGIIPWHEVFAERFLYLPSVGVFAGIAAAMTTLARRHRREALVVASVAVLAFAGLAIQRNRVWSGPIPLWGSAVERYPRAARSHKALADAYLEQTRADLALEHYQRAVEVFPNYIDARTGIAVAQMGRREFAKALETLEDTLDRWPSDAKTLNAKAYVHETLGNWKLAMEGYQQAVDHDPTFADGYNNLARMYVHRGELERAVEMYERALEHNPAMVTALRNLATVYREGYGDVEKAEYYEAQVLKLEAVR